MKSSKYNTQTKQQIIRSALNQLTHSQEAKHYLKRYQNHDEMNFAVVKVGGGTLADELEILAESLALLSHLGLNPIVIHGAGVQLDKGLAHAGIKTSKKNGMRVTDEACMKVIRPVMYDVNHQLVRALEQQGVRAYGVVHGVFECRYLDQQTYGLVGDVEKIHLSPIKQAIQTGSIPVLSCLGETASGQVLNINADVATRELVWKIHPHKIIFVTPTGGILDNKSDIISAIQLNNDFDYMIQQPWLHSGMKLKLQQIKDMLAPLDCGHSVSITSSKNLARELFTYKGAGTFINMGEKINESLELDQSNLSLLHAIFEDAFGRTFKTDFLSNLKIKKIYLAESGRAAAIISSGFRNHAYLHKFAVTKAGQGEGLAASLWQQIIKDFPQLYWRSRTNNDINDWYFKQADVSVKSTAGDWVGFSCGLFPAESLECIQQAFKVDSGWQSIHEQTTVSIQQNVKEAHHV